MTSGSGTGIALNDFPTRSSATIRGTSFIKLLQLADLGAGIGDDLLAVAVIEFLRHLERLGRRPAEARTAKFLQRGQIVQLGRSLPLFLDAHTKRAFEATSRVHHFLGKLAPDNPLLRRV